VTPFLNSYNFGSFTYAIGSLRNDNTKCCVLSYTLWTQVYFKRKYKYWTLLIKPTRCTNSSNSFLE